MDARGETESEGGVLSEGERELEDRQCGYGVEGQERRGAEAVALVQTNGSPGSSTTRLHSRPHNEENGSRGKDRRKEEEFEEEDSDGGETEAEWEEEETVRLPLFVRLCCLTSAAVAVGILFLLFAVWLYAVPEGPQPLRPFDAAVRAEHYLEGVATVLWEAPTCGSATHYRILRYNALTRVWTELPGSPTPRLGVRDSGLPSPGGGRSLVYYRIAAEDGVNRRRGFSSAVSFRLAEPGTGGLGSVFWAPTSDRAPAPPEKLFLADISRNAEERELLLKWEAAAQLEHEHGPAPLGYAVYVWCFASGRWEEVEKYDGFRRHLHYPVRSGGRHCFLVKAQAWGAVGWSAPSRPLCIYVEGWAYALAAHAVVTSFPTASASAPQLLGRLPSSATSSELASAAAATVEHYAPVPLEAFADQQHPMALL